MSNLNEVKWKVFKFSDIFIIKNGYYSKKPPIEGGNIPFLSATKYNNGVSAFYSEEIINTYDKSGKISNKNINNRIFKGNCLSINNNGSVGYTFYQKSDFSCSSDVSVVYLKNHTLNEHIAKFLIKVAMDTGKCFNYARKWKPNRMCNSKIMLPIDNQGDPNWLFMENFIKEKELPKIQKLLSFYKNKLSSITVNQNLIASKSKDKRSFISDKDEIYTTCEKINWKQFSVIELFTYITRGKRLKEADRETGNIPFITAGAFNNGISSFINNEKHKLHHNAITIDMFGNAFYQNSYFKCDDNITVLKNDKFSKNIYMFLVTALQILKQKYSYAQQLRPNRIARDKIMLPVDDQGNPNWSYMENFIKVKERNQIQKIIKHFEKRFSELTN